MTIFIPALCAAITFLSPADFKYSPAKRNLTCHGYYALDRYLVSAETIDVAIAAPADGPSLGTAPSGT